jgi:hypothetical protein
MFSSNETTGCVKGTGLATLPHRRGSVKGWMTLIKTI